MLRATSVLLLIGGVTLLVTWGVLPAESQASRTLSRVAAPAFDGPAELAEVNAELGRLTDRLDRRVALPPPGRDPFSFVVRPSRSLATAPPPVVALEPAVSPEPIWPTLVAIMEGSDAGSFEVALTDDESDLQVVKTGSTVGAFVVTAITADAVVVTESASGRSTRLTVR